MRTYQKGRLLSLLALIFLTALFVLNLSQPANFALAGNFPDGPTYDDPPPGPAFVPNLTHLPGAAAHQEFGISAHSWWLDWWLDLFTGYYKDLKIGTVRLTLNWKEIEPQPGQYDWHLYDRLLDRLADENLDVVVEFVTVPVWASVNPKECAASDLNCALDARYLPNLTRSASEVARHYPFVRYWEFWNEPDQWPYLGKTDIKDYAQPLKAFYAGIKQADPSLWVAATSLAGPEYVDWLYNYSDSLFGMRPWDAVAYHPYLEHVPDPLGDGQVLGIRKNRVDQLRQLMVTKGDAAKPIWLTEIGWEMTPAKQSILLKDTLNWIAKRPFITLVHLHMLHDWDSEIYGLLRVKQEVYHKRPLQPTDQFEPKQPYYDTFKNYDKRSLPTQPAASATTLVFPQTGHVVRDEFKTAWEQGGLTLYGYPTTEQFYERNPDDSHYYLVQYFERVRMEYHPENKGSRYEVLFGLLGKQVLTKRGWFDEQGRPVAPQVQPESRPLNLAADAQWFGETGHSLSGFFLQAWQNHGGLALIGLPLSGVFAERNPDDGQTYLVQYFERSRAELHYAPDGHAFVLFGLLGNEVMREQGRLLPNNAPNLANYYNPAQPEFR